MVNGFKTWIFSGYSVKATHVIAPPPPPHAKTPPRQREILIQGIELFILIINLIFNLILILIFFLF